VQNEFLNSLGFEHDSKERRITEISVKVNGIEIGYRGSVARS